MTSAGYPGPRTPVAPGAPGVAVSRAGEDALEELPALCEARLAALEEQRQDVLGPGLVAVRVEEHLIREAVHGLATLWPGSGEHEAAGEPRADQHQLLRDVSAER